MNIGKRDLLRLAVVLALSAPLLLATAWAAAGAAHGQGEAAAIAGAGVPPKVPACAACHGARGEGIAAYPHLAGTGVDYLREQLEAFAAGSRKSPVMEPIAQALTAQQRGQLAAYFASLPAVRAAAVDREARNASDVGAWLATRGRWSDGVPACAQCHGPGGVGVGASFPPLAGQPAAYISAQLKAWQAGSRPAGPLGLMQAIARKLKEADIQAVSEYYAGLAASTPAAAAAPGAEVKR